jgi:threonine/homoserine/homoserine lactone efflux protein
MAAIDSMTAGKALGLGFVLAAVNPKNLLLAISAGIAVGAADLTVGEMVVVIAVFTLIAASTVLVPVLAYLTASQRMGAPLGRLRGWLVHNNATIMAVVLLVLGTSVIGKGIGSF